MLNYTPRAPGSGEVDTLIEAAKVNRHGHLGPLSEVPKGRGLASDFWSYMRKQPKGTPIRSPGVIPLEGQTNQMVAAP
jgi:hypothetical protein